MAFETHLISLEDNATPQELEQVIRTLNRIKGKVNMVAKDCIIATFDNAHVDTIRKHKGVKLVGGVNFRGRRIRKVVKKDQSRD
ncbi:MAG: hypothetical protein ACLFVX_11170 [Archaeoglobaceae archaeon]